MSTTDNNHPLAGRRLYIPRMSTGGARVMAAAFRSLGVDAHVSPESDEETLTLAAKFTTGEECLPQRVTLGNQLKIILADDFDPSKNAFFMPTSAGPCRFGQYAPLLKKVLKELDYEETLVFSPTSSNGYAGVAENTTHFLRTGWRAILVSDMLRKLALMFRPYEAEKGRTDRVHGQSLDRVCQVFADGSLNSSAQMKALVHALKEVRDLFLSIPLAEKRGTRPLIGVVGEIYLRFNSFSNQDVLRRIEAHGGEAWIADISEWVWYTNNEERRKLREAGKKYSPAMLMTLLRHGVQRLDEWRLHRPLAPLFHGREEARVEKILEYSWPYLPSNKALGEMTLNAGNAIAYYHAGCHGVVDISPFTCMNGIVSEVIYPHISRNHDHIPIRIFYFDGVPIDLDGDLEIFMEQAKSYQRKRMK